MKCTFKPVIALLISLSSFSLFAQDATTVVTPTTNPSAVVTNPPANPNAPAIPTIPIPGTTPTINTSAADDAINTNVQGKISADTLLAGTNITTATVNGVVTLNGTVSTQAQLTEAIRVTHTV